MKKILFIYLILINLTSFAQKSDSTHTRYGLYRGFSIHLTELKAKRGILNGEYKIFAGKSVIAFGNYKNGERVGKWQFFLKNDTIDQVYDYTSKKLEFNRIDKKLTFFIDSLKDGDKVIAPAKIAGTLGLFLLTRNYIPPFEIQKSVGEFNLYFIFTIDKWGKLIKYETKVASLNFNKVEEANLKKLKTEDFEFVPAKVNGVNVASVLVLEGLLNVNLNH